MKKLLGFLVGFLLSNAVIAQTVGTTKTENYKASFETKVDISQFLDYEGKQIPIQILKCGIGDEVYEQYPCQSVVWHGIQSLFEDSLCEFRCFSVFHMAAMP